MTLEHVYLPDSWVLSIETDDRYRDRADPLGTRDRRDSANISPRRRPGDIL